MATKIRLGNEIEDVVTKAKGIAHGYVEYLDGSTFWIIQPPYDEGEKVSEVHAPTQYCRYVADGVLQDEKPKPIMGFKAPERLE